MCEMALKQKQQIARIQAEVIPGQNQTLSQYLGTDAQWDIDWASFEEGEAIYGLSSFLTNAANGIEAVTRDQVGKETVSKAFTRVVVKNVETPAEKRIFVEGGALHLYSAMTSDDWSGRIGSTDVQQWLENNL